jgi:nitrile hydratase
MQNFLNIGWNPLMPHDHHDHDHSHDHLSPSGHPYQPDQDHQLTRWQCMEIAMRELLVEKGILTAAEITATVEQMDRRSPADGARVVAHAWADPAFKARLLANGTEAIKEMGIEPGVLKLIAVENTATIHNVVVCTLCSCYPRNLLGLPPDWYKQRAYRSRVVKTPRKVLSEFGLELPDSTTVRVHDSTADMRYLVIPARPAGTESMDEAALSALVSRDAMIGVATATHL